MPTIWDTPPPGHDANRIWEAFTTFRGQPEVFDLVGLLIEPNRAWGGQPIDVRERWGHGGRRERRKRIVSYLLGKWRHQPWKVAPRSLFRERVDFDPHLTWYHWALRGGAPPDVVAAHEPALDPVTQFAGQPIYDLRRARLGTDIHITARTALAHPVDLRWLYRQVQSISRGAYPPLGRHKEVYLLAGDPKTLLDATHVPRLKSHRTLLSKERIQARQELRRLYDALPTIVEWAAITETRLGGMSWREAHERAQTWHATALEIERVAELESEMRRLAPPQAVLRGDELPEDWTLVKFTRGSKAQYAEEGRKLHHCVGTYANHNTDIYSLRFRGEPAVTFQIAHARLSQAKSYRNQPAGMKSPEAWRLFFRAAKADRLDLVDDVTIYPGVLPALERTLAAFKHRGITVNIEGGDLRAFKLWKEALEPEGRRGRRQPLGRPVRVELEALAGVDALEEELSTPGGLSYKDALRMIETRGKRGTLSISPMRLVRRADHVAVYARWGARLTGLASREVFRIYPKRWVLFIPVAAIRRHSRLSLWTRLTPAKFYATKASIGYGGDWTRPALPRGTFLMAHIPGKARGKNRPADWLMWSLVPRGEAPWNPGRYAACIAVLEIDARGVLLDGYLDCPEPPTGLITRVD